MTFLAIYSEVRIILKSIVKARRNLAKADKATDAHRDKLKAKIIERGQPT